MNEPCHNTVYNFKAELKKGWKDNPQKEVDAFFEEINKAFSFIQSISNNEVLNIEEASVDFKINTTYINQE